MLPWLQKHLKANSTPLNKVFAHDMPWKEKTLVATFRSVNATSITQAANYVISLKSKCAAFAKAKVKFHKHLKFFPLFFSLLVSNYMYLTFSVASV